MTEKEVGGVVVDQCTFGHGMWFDSGELGRFAAGVAPSRIVTTDMRDRLDGKVINPSVDVEVFNDRADCPVCGEEMEHEEFREGMGPVMDRCAEHGVWLDAGELDRIRNLQSALKRSVAVAGDARGGSLPSDLDTTDAHDVALALQESVRANEVDEGFIQGVASRLSELFRR